MVTYVVVALLPFFVTTLLYTVVTTGSMPWSWFWVFVTGFVVAKRIWSVRRGGWRSVGLAALVVPEIIYDVVLHCVYVKALTYSVLHTRETWDRPSLTEAGQKRAWWHGVAGLLFTGGLLAVAVGLALVCSVLGVAWPIISFLVLAGAAVAVLAAQWTGPHGTVVPQRRACPGRLRPGSADHRASVAGTSRRTVRNRSHKVPRTRCDSWLDRPVPHGGRLIARPRPGVNCEATPHPRIGTCRHSLGDHLSGCREATQPACREHWHRPGVLSEPGGIHRQPVPHGSEGR